MLRTRNQNTLQIPLPKYIFKREEKKNMSPNVRIEFKFWVNKRFVGVQVYIFHMNGIRYANTRDYSGRHGLVIRCNTPRIFFRQLVGVRYLIEL